jgi:putative transposase
LFENLAEVRVMTEEWNDDYNNERPHKSLGYLFLVKNVLNEDPKPKI